MIRRNTILALALLALLPAASTVAATERPLVFHVKTALSVDDAQICVVPNVAWAALAAGRPVTIVFDGSAGADHDQIEGVVHHGIPKGCGQ